MHRSKKAIIQSTPGVHPGGGARVSAGGGTGGAREVPLGPQPGINHIDRLIDAQDAKDRVEPAQRLATRRKS